MALEIKQQLRQTQQLVMTPQLQQAIKLLQYNHIEMISALEQEVRENPLLEVLPNEEPFPEQDTKTPNNLNSLEEANKEPDSSQTALLDPKDVFDIDWENYLDSYGGDYSPSLRDPAERPPLENMITYSENLFENLVHQLQTSNVEGHDRRVAFEIIGNLNENGFLDVGLDELATTFDMSVEDVERVLALVQEFDPPGIADLGKGTL